jgi:hypothetical protein
MVVPLPAPTADVAVGGGGRFLVLSMPETRRFSVFDVNAAKVVKELPLSAKSALIAAGWDKIVVVDPGAKSVERWSLLTFEREATAPLEMKVPPVAAAMGSESAGPLVISGVDWPRLGETVFFDVRSMREYDLPINRHGIFETSNQVWLRASSDGKLFAAQQFPLGGRTQTGVWEKGSVTLHGGPAGGMPVPGPDGKTIYTADGIFSGQLQPLGGAGTAFLPAHHGPFYLGLPRVGTPAPKATLAMYLAGQATPFAHVAEVAGLGETNLLPGDKLIHFLPDAGLIITLPGKADRLVLHRFDPQQALEKSGRDYVLVTSRPPGTARAGGAYVYQMQTKSRKGGVRCRLDSGPPGMAIDAGGRLTWQVPADFAGTSADVRVYVRDLAGQEASHAFTIRIVG